MKYKTVTECVGELLGPVDWSYEFIRHFDNSCCSAEQKAADCEQSKRWLRMIEENPEKYEVTTYGGWPRCGWGPVVSVGMYDGWPYWRPVPSVAYATLLGVDWTSFSGITNIRNRETKEIVP